ncbi:hypothetical protein LXM25_06140 [Dyadobacter sp. LJ53]|uniref:hypothetical protein n=1 Tax=Dyadobacter chenwenxiniae TaxID=2906456 RepID=UPI001F17A51E|nr:hypothetical protein [Dyadobacter chenwenxiniae]MCF0049624.1 hypothetical protein [Dyadobacter chenwenxiniae]
MSAISKHSWLIWFLIVICCIATLSFFISDAALDIPFIDDYNALLDFIIQYLRAGSLLDKIHFIFRQHNEHRIGYARIIVLLDYYLFGCTNLRHLIFFGSINLFLVTIIFCVEACKSSKNVLAIIPVVLLSFHFQHMGSLLWATSALQNLGVIALACSAIWLVTRSDATAPSIGVIFAFITTFASGTGPMIWIVFIVVALAGGDMVKGAIMLALGICSVYLFLLSYHFPVVEDTSIATKLMNMPEICLGIIGGTFDIHERGTPFIPVLAGFLIISIFVLCLGRTGLKAIQKDPASQFLIGAFLFGLLSAIAISLGRGSYVENRYKVISTLCLLATYNMVLSQLPRKWMDISLNVINVACLGLWLLFFWRYYPEMLEYKSVRKAEYLTILNSPQRAESSFHQRINALKDLGIKSPDDPAIQNTFISSKYTNDISLQSPKILKRSNKYAVKWRDEPGLFNESYLVLKSDSGSCVFPVRKKRNLLSDFLLSGGHLFATEREAYISYDWIPKGRYTISVYLPEQTSFISIQDTIVVTQNVTPWLSDRWFNDVYIP